jgi:hypothetical protein
MIGAFVNRVLNKKTVRGTDDVVEDDEVSFVRSLELISPSLFNSSATTGAY